MDTFRSDPSRQVSAHGEIVVKQLEGKAGANGAPMLKAYRDSGGKWTIGWGHTSDVIEGMVITAAQAEQFLHDDLRAAELAVIKWITVPLNDNQFDTLVIFVLNVGEEQFRTSTLVKILNKGDYTGVPAQLSKWIYDNKVVVPGLINRRAAEAALWVTPVDVAPITLPPVTVQVDPSTTIQVQSPTLPAKVAEITIPSAPATNAARTKTGATTIGALLTGGGGTIIAGVTQGQQYIQAFRAALGGWADDKAWWKALTVVLVAGSIGFSVWTYLHKQRSISQP